jgi:translation initiation factor 1A
MENEFGDFQEIKEEVPQNSDQPQPETPTRIRMPRNKELMGIVVQRLGGNRMEIKTTDGKSRNCRVPGRFKRRFWLRPGDIVLIIPWDLDDTKGDIVFQYKKGLKFQLKKRGLLDKLQQEF